MTVFLLNWHFYETVWSSAKPREVILIVTFNAAPFFSLTLAFIDGSGSSLKVRSSSTFRTRLALCLPHFVLILVDRARHAFVCLQVCESTSATRHFHEKNKRSGFNFNWNRPLSNLRAFLTDVAVTLRHSSSRKSSKSGGAALNTTTERSAICRTVVFVESDWTILTRVRSEIQLLTTRTRC